VAVQLRDFEASTIPSVRPFVACLVLWYQRVYLSLPTGCLTTTMASADFSPPSTRTVLGRPFRREARSPQVRSVTFTAQPPDLRRLTFGCESFAVLGPLALVGSASYPVSVRRLAAPLPASFSADLTVGPVARLVALRFTRGRCNLLPRRTFTSVSRPCWAHQRKGAGRKPAPVADALRTRRGPHRSPLHVPPRSPLKITFTVPSQTPSFRWSASLS